MTYIVFRHENAFGNTCEQIINLAIQIKKDNVNSEDVAIAVEHQWQKDIVRLIHGSDKFKIIVMGDDLNESYKNDWRNLSVILDDPIVPSYYSNSNTKSYNAGWEYIESSHLPILIKQNGQQFDIVIQFRVKDSWKWRGESGQLDISRYVKQENFIKLIKHLCELGFRVARIGGPSHKKIFEHPNFTDTTLNTGISLKRQLELISNARLFISTDSSIWPLGPALGIPTIVSNITSVFEFLEPLPIVCFGKFFLPHGKIIARKKDIGVKKSYIFDWIKPQNSYILKHIRLFFGVIKVTDNSLDDMLTEVKASLL